MKKRTLAAVMATAIVLAITGCGNSGATKESAAAATTQDAAAEIADKVEWPDDSTSYLSGITASDYVDLPADYAFLTVEVAPVKGVTEEEVEADIEKYRQSRKELKEVTKRNKVQEGDVVNIDYVGRIDGEEFDGGSAEDYNLEIGSKTFIAGFEDGLIGSKVGETVTLELTFPADYADSTKAGADAEFDVTINSIQQYDVPKLTDQFVTDLGITDDFGNSVNTVEDLRKYVRSRFVYQNELDYTSRLEGAILNALLEKTTFKKDFPEAMVERTNDLVVQQADASARANYGQYGINDAKTLYLLRDKTEEEYEQDVKDAVSYEIKSSILLKAIADKEGLCISDDDFQAKLEEFAEEYGYDSVEDIPREDRELYREILNERKVIDFLKSKTIVTAPAAEEGSTAATEEAAEAEAAK